MCVCLCLHSTCVYMYMYACMVPAYTCMHLHYMHVRVCMYGSCVYVYAFTLHACTYMHLRYMRVRVCIYITFHACFVRITTSKGSTRLTLAYITLSLEQIQLMAGILQQAMQPVENSEAYVQSRNANLYVYI